MSLINKYAWRGTAVALAALLAFAMFMVSPAQQAFADVVAPVTIEDEDDNVLAPGALVATQTLTAVADINDIDDGDEVTFEVFVGEAEFENGADSITCVLDVDADDGAVSTGTTNCAVTAQTPDTGLSAVPQVAATGDATATVEVDFTPAGSGDITIRVVHDDDDGLDAETVEVSTFGAAPEDADELQVVAPVAVEAGDEDVEVTVTAVDENGNPVEGLPINVQATDADATNDPQTTDDDGEAVFTFDIDDDADGVVLTFFTNVGSIVQGDLVETVAIAVAGAADSIEIEAPAAVEEGATATVAATVLDEDGDPVPGAGIDFVVSAGSLVACDETTSSSGVADCTFVAPSAAQSVQVTVVSAGAVAQATLQVTGETDPTDPTPGDGEISNVPAPGNFGLATGGGTFEELVAEASAQGCPNVTIWVTPATGGLVPYVAGVAVPAVNAPAMAAFPNGVPAGSALLIDCDI